MRRYTVLLILLLVFVSSAESSGLYGVSETISARATVTQPVGIVDFQIQESEIQGAVVESHEVPLLLIGPRAGNIIVMIDGTEIPRERLILSIVNIDRFNLNSSLLHKSSAITLIYADN